MSGRVYSTCEEIQPTVCLQYVRDENLGMVIQTYEPFELCFLDKPNV